MWIATARAQECGASSTTADLQDAIEEAQVRLAELDIAAFKEATHGIERLVPCLRESLPAHLAAEVHRTRAILLFGERDPSSSWVFAAARAIEPGYAFPTTLIPEGNPVREAYGRVDLSEGKTVAVPPPASGHLQFDGTSALERPIRWPTIVQVFDATGRVAVTAYLAPSDPLPPYPVSTAPVAAAPVPVPPAPGTTADSATAASTRPPPPAPLPRVRPPRTPAEHPLRLPLVMGAGAAAVTSGVLYGVAGMSHAAFESESTADEDLSALRSRTNGLIVASALTGTAAIGLGVGAAVTW